MLSFFRRITNSKAGVVITFIVLGVIAIAFAAGDVTGLRTGSGGIVGGDVASVGKAEVTANDLRTRVQNEMEGYRQQQPTLDMATYIAQGGFDGTLDRIVSAIAFEQFGGSQGMVVSKRAIDGQIASIPSLQGPTGKFDPNLFQRVLAERKITEASVRADIVRDTLSQQLIAPTQGATQVPDGVALPYASLLLEKRNGQIAFIPTAAMGEGAPATDAEAATFYARNVARYTVPQRRIIRYAIVTPDQVKARAVPTDAEIAQTYQADRAKYAATEKRSVTQVVVADEAGANALAAKVKGGTPIADAAKAAGLEPLVQTGVEKAAYAGTSSPQIADAVFAAAKGAVIGPVRGPLGWTVVRVENVEQVAARSLDQVRAEIATALGIQKSAAALGSVHDAIDDALGKNATFDEIVADQKLSPTTTPGLIAAGVNPDDPASKPDTKLAQIVAAGFQANEGDPPQMVQVGADGSFAVVALGRVLPAAPRALAQIRAQVGRDFQIDRARLAARKVAGEVLAKVQKGTPLQQALAQTGKTVPPVRPLAASRAQLSENPKGAPPPLALMFSMVQGGAKLLEAPQNGGWFVIKLDHIDAGNATGNAAVIRAARIDMGRTIGREYVEQFARAVRAQVGVKTDAKAVAGVRADLLGQGGAPN